MGRACTTVCKVALFLAPLSAAHAQISGLFNTGVDGSRSKQVVGTTDSHYTVLENGGAQAIVTNNGAYAQDPNSAYIWQTASGDQGSVTRTFRTTFTVDAGFDPTTAFLTGKWSTDNYGVDILLNGVSSGNVSPSYYFTAFAINAGFVAGLNTLDFIVSDFGAPAGFNAGDLRGSANPLVSTTPEPASIFLLASGMAGIGFARRLRRRNA